MEQLMKYILKKSEGSIKNIVYKDTCNMRHTSHRTKKN